MKDALKLALEALEKTVDNFPANTQHANAITAIKEALAQPEQEPCGGCGGSGWVPRDPDIGTDQECFNCNGSGTQPNEPEQEPVAFSCLRCVTPKKCAVHGCSPNTWPSEFSPKRPWVGLTDEEKQIIYQSMMWGPSIYGYADAIEAKLKELNT